MYPGMFPGPGGELLQAPAGEPTAGQFVRFVGITNGVLTTEWATVAAPDLSEYAQLAGAAFTGDVSIAAGEQLILEFAAGVPGTGAKYEFRNGSSWFSVTNGSTGRGNILADTLWATGVFAALDGGWRVTPGGGYVQYIADPGYAGHQFTTSVSVLGTATISGNVGIGGSSPSFPLDVTGFAYFRNDLDVVGTLFAENHVQAPEYRQRSASSPLVFRSMQDHTGGVRHTEWRDYNGTVAMWLYGNQYGAAELGVMTISTTGLYTGVAWQPITIQAGGAFGLTNDILRLNSGDGTTRATIGYLGGLTLNDFATIGGNLTPGPSTFAALPSAAASAGAMRRVTDRSQRLAYSDGTDWRWISDDTIAS